SDEFMMRTAPGHDFGGWRPEPGRCDHCGKYRDRNTTYLVTSPDTGQTLQVGASCMEAFLRIKPKGLWTLGLGADDLHDDDQPPQAATTQVTDTRELPANALIATDMGKRYVSKPRAAERGASPTADRIAHLFSPVIYRRLPPEERAEREQAHEQLPR